jgi:RNA polymerase-binding transcription factor DksA
MRWDDEGSDGALDDDLWAYVPGDDRPGQAPPPEWRALHLVDREGDTGSGEDDPDRPGAGRSRRRPPEEREPDVDELLIQQHYMPPDRPVSAAGGPRRATSPAGPPGRRPIAEDEAGALLAGERRRLEAVRRALTGHAEDRDEPSPAGHHLADWASDTLAREVDESVLETVAAELAELDAAETRLRGHRYGWCERCSEAIDAERLRAEPATRWCVTHRLDAAEG